MLYWAIENQYLPFWFALVFSIIFSVLTSLAISKLNRLSVWLFASGTGVLLLSGVLLAMQERRHQLLFSLFALATTMIFAVERVRLILRLPYYFSNRKWWESYPKALPRQVAVIFESEKKEKTHSVIITNMGNVGCFIFFTQGEPDFVPGWIEIALEKNKQYTGRVVPVYTTKDGLGMGLKFQMSGADNRKDLGDYLLKIRRMGYGLE